MSKFWPIFILVVAVLAVGSYFLKTARPNVTNFEECGAAGYPVMESYPERCATPDGKTFARDIGDELDKADLVKVSSPRPNEQVSSPLKIQGEARGTWFFEASFPVKLLDESSNELATGVAQAKGEWMTTEFVPFETTLSFSVPPGVKKGNLILEKDNPSGKPANDDSFRIPVKFE